MKDLISAIDGVRDSVAAVMKISPNSVASTFNVAFVGTAWCVVESRCFVTAHHIFNEGKPRNKEDQFLLFFVPNNGPKAFHTPVAGFILEDSANDMAVVEIKALPASLPRVPAIPVSFKHQPDGTNVLTYGFPSPVIASASVDAKGNWTGGQLMLKSHANEGIVAGQYHDRAGPLVYELNVGWHHGESGGPVCQLEPLAAFAVMQSYRRIQSAHNVFAGPHQGRSLNVIRDTFQSIGALIIE